MGQNGNKTFFRKTQNRLGFQLSKWIFYANFPCTVSSMWFRLDNFFSRARSRSRLRAIQICATQLKGPKISELVLKIQQLVQHWWTWSLPIYRQDVQIHTKGKSCSHRRRENVPSVDVIIRKLMNVLFRVRKKIGKETGDEWERREKIGAVSLSPSSPDLPWPPLLTVERGLPLQLAYSLNDDPMTNDITDSANMFRSLW